MKRFQNAVLAVAVLAASVALAGPAKKLDVTAHTTAEAAGLQSSYAIHSDGEIVVVDAPMTKPEADLFIGKVQKLKGKVTTIYLTHAHPDHGLGLPFLKAAFPEAKIVAVPEVVEAWSKAGAGMLTFYQGFNGGAWKPALATEVVVPEKHEGKTLKVGTQELEIWSFKDAEVAHATALWHKDSKSLFTGDMTFNNVHLWVKDTKPATWIVALEELKKLGAKKVHPGHGEPGDAKVIAWTTDYLKHFEKEVATSKDVADIVAKMKKKFAKARAPFLLEWSAGPYFAPTTATGTITGGADAGTKSVTGSKDGGK